MKYLICVLLLGACVDGVCDTQTALNKQENEYLKRDILKKEARIRELEARLFDKQQKDDDGALSRIQKFFD